MLDQAGSPIALACAVAVLVLLALSVGPPVMADSRGDNDLYAGEPIVVVGSHLNRVAGPVPFPLVTLDAEDLRRVAASRLGDYLPYLPLNFNSVGSGDAVGTAGHATRSFNLRGLGRDATLTLIDGLRVAPYGTRNHRDFVNVNAIPMQAIERIEILKEGASALYGADAVAGVVNIVLRKDYDGAALALDLYDTEAGGARRNGADFVYGHQHDQTGLMVALSWYAEDPLWMRERDIVASADARGRGGYDQRSINSDPPNLMPRDELINDGRFRLVTDPACPEQGPRASQEVDRRFGGNVCRYNFNELVTATGASERYSGFLVLDRQLGDSVSAELQLGYDDTVSEGHFAPQPAVSSALPDSLSTRALVRADHPDNPLGVDVEIFYRPGALGPRIGTETARGRRAALRFDGSLQRARAWHWRAHLAWSDMHVDIEARNNINIFSMQEALLGRGGPARDQFFNPFGAGSRNDSALLASLRVDLHDRVRRRERAAGATLSNSAVARLPAGDVGLAIGAEWRDQDQWQTFDPQAASGELSQGSAVFDALSVGRRVGSVVGELRVPVLPSLQAQVAQRYERYNDFGRELSSKAGLLWRPVRGIALRAGYAEAFHAPSFRDMFELPTQTVAFVSDSARCPLTGAEIDCERFFYDAQFGGNVALGPERVESTVVGLAWEPRRLNGLAIELDFWRFDYRDRIGFLSFQDLVDGFGGDPTVVERAAPSADDLRLGVPGRILAVHSRPFNVSKLVTDGIDLALGIERSWPTIGEFRFEARQTYIDTYRFDGLEGAFVDGLNLAGRSDGRLAVPRWRATHFVSLERGRNTVTAAVRYVDDYRDRTNLPDADGRESDVAHFTGSWTVFDLQFAHRLPVGARFAAGCENCLDRVPPLSFTGLPGGANMGDHDLRLRSWYVRWTQDLGQLGRRLAARR